MPHLDGRFINVPRDAFKYLCYPEMCFDMLAHFVPFPEGLCETSWPGAFVRCVPRNLTRFEPLIQ